MKWWTAWLLTSSIPWSFTLFFVWLRVWPGVFLEAGLGSVFLFVTVKRFRQNR